MNKLKWNSAGKKKGNLDDKHNLTSKIFMANKIAEKLKEKKSKEKKSGFRNRILYS